jgi:metal-dependent HD superfamily phosphatase/phosphodiesterase
LRRSEQRQKKTNKGPSDKAVKTRVGSEPDIDRLVNHPKALHYIESADRYLESIGYTEHGMRHSRIVSRTAYRILKKLSYPERAAKLAASAGFLHDIGNMLGREIHHKMGAFLAKEVLEEVGYDLEGITGIMTAIVIHEENEGSIPDEVAAALIIADKSEVHRSRVRNPSMVSVDIHDRVNYATTESDLDVDPDKNMITLSLSIDTRISPVIEYFEIFLSRMTVCRKAARVLGTEFNLYINGTRMA